MLSVKYEPFKLSDIMLNIVMLNFAALALLLSGQGIYHTKAWILKQQR
jgi:hypothetical protein